MEMINFFVRDLFALLEWVGRMIAHTRSEENTRGAQVLTESEKKVVKQQVQCLRKDAILLELSEVAKGCDSLSTEIESLTLGDTRGRLATISHEIRHTLDERLFMYVPQRHAKYGPPTAGKRRELLSGKSIEEITSDHLFPFGRTVYKKFASAKYDIRKAHLCMMVDASTAAVFHLMRAVEHGLRALAIHHGIRRLRRKKKSGKFTWVQLEHSEWGQILDTLQSKIMEKAAKAKRGKDRLLAEQYYIPLVQDIRGFKDVWRNHVMHSRKTYRIGEAETALFHVRRFMQTLATRVSEVEDED